MGASGSNMKLGLPSHFLTAHVPQKKCRPLKLFHALSTFEYLNHVEKHTHMEMKNKLRREH